MLNTVRGSTDASSPPATGRSNVTVTASVASPSLSGVTRSTRSGSTDTATAPSVSKTAVRTENIGATRGGDSLNLPAIGGSGAQRSREDAEPRALSLTPWLRPVQNDEGDPREPAHPLAPAQRPQHQPRLRDRRLPRGVRPLEQRHRAGEHVVRPVPVRGRVVTFQTQVAFPQPWLSLAPVTRRSCPAASSSTSRRAAGGKASP